MRYVPWILAAIVAGLLWVQHGQLGAARADLATARAAVAGQQEAAKWRARQASADLAAAMLDRDLSEGAGADAGLSDYMRGAAVRLWP